MTNMEKLYALAGIEKRFKAYTEDGRVKYFHTLDEIIKSKIYYRPDMYCCDLDDDAKEYPLFTDTKQLELIKWLAKTRPIHITNICGDLVVESFVRYNKKYPTFEQALAGLVCELWKDLTDTQREEVKGILQ